MHARILPEMRCIVRKGDAEPGVKAICIGLERVTDFAAGLRYMHMRDNDFDHLDACVVWVIPWAKRWLYIPARSTSSKSIPTPVFRTQVR